MLDIGIWESFIENKLCVYIYIYIYTHKHTIRIILLSVDIINIYLFDEVIFYNVHAFFPQKVSFLQIICIQIIRLSIYIVNIYSFVEGFKKIYNQNVYMQQTNISTLHIYDQYICMYLFVCLLACFFKYNLHLFIWWFVVNWKFWQHLSHPYVVPFQTCRTDFLLLNTYIDVWNFF